MLSACNLSLVYESSNILKEVNFSCDSSESIVITGASGSGKSSFLHLLSGLQNPSSGVVSWEEKDISKMSLSKLLKWRRQNLGFVFQYHHLLNDFSVQENIAIPCLLAGDSVSDANLKVYNILKKLDMLDKKNQSINTLSGGERQRVAVARAVVHSPKFLLADEPTGSLNTELAEKTIDLMFELASDSSIILVTHNLSLVNRFDRHIVLNQGDLIEQ